MERQPDFPFSIDRSPRFAPQPKDSSGVSLFKHYICLMTNSGKLLLCVLAALVSWPAIRAAGNETSGGNPYQAIVDRNVFGLKPPPPPPDPEANKPPPPKILLTGIYEMGGTKRVLMKVSMPAKPPEPAKEIPLTLSERQRDGEIEVLEIDTVARTAKVNNHGTITSLDFTNNGVKVAATPAPGKPAAPTPPTRTPTPHPGAVKRNWPPEPTTPEEAAIREAAYMMRNKAAIDRGELPPLPGNNPLLQNQPAPTQTPVQMQPPPMPPLPPGAARASPY